MFPTVSLPLIIVQVDYNACSVPGCVVSRNTLGKWRRAAMEGFLFPPSLSLCLHPCPPGQRQRWVAECDLEPTSRVRPVVCSLHFRDGRPTRENPFPSELLGEPVTGRPVYRGVRPAGGSADLGQFASLEARTFSGQVLEALMQKVEEKINKINKKDDKRLSDIAQYRNIKYQKLLKVNKRRLKKLKSKKKYSKGNPLLQFVMKLNRKPHKRRVSGNLSCKFCKDKFTFTKSLYHHVRYVHFASLLKRKATPETVITEEERRRALQSLYPDSLAAPLDPKKKYVCAVCKSVCDLHGLFIHMKTVHGGLLCQYCLKLFKKVRDLETHLAAAHRTAPRYYAGAEQLVAASGSEYSLACGECSQLVSVAGLESHQCGPARYLLFIFSFINSHQPIVSSPFNETDITLQAQLGLRVVWAAAWQPVRARASHCQSVVSGRPGPRPARRPVPGADRGRAGGGPAGRGAGGGEVAPHCGRQLHQPSDLRSRSLLLRRPRSVGPIRGGGAGGRAGSRAGGTSA